MGKLISIAIFVAFIIFAAAGIARVGNNVEQSGLALVATGMRESELKEFIREYYRTEILENPTALTDGKDEISIRYLDVDTNGSKDLVVTVDSKPTCGSGGCITTIFLTNDMREPTPVRTFKYATRELEVLESITMGMHDLELNGSKKNRMTWDGTQYIPESN